MKTILLPRFNKNRIIIKRYTISIDEKFTQKRANELIEYLKAIKDDLRKIQWNPEKVLLLMLINGRKIANAMDVEKIMRYKK